MVVLGDDRVSWNEMQRRAGQVANALVADGLGSQDRVAFIDKNSIEFFELAFGAAYVNAVTVAVNWRLAPPEMAYIINDSQAKVLIVHEEFAGHLATFEADLVHTTRIVVIGSHDSHASYDAWRDAHDGAFQRVGSTDEDVAAQLYTSGTTGLPKGAQLTNANFQALFATVDWDMGEDSRNLCVMPLFHIAGSGWALFGMANGAVTVMMREFDPVAGLQIVESEAARMRSSCRPSSSSSSWSPATASTSRPCSTSPTGPRRSPRTCSSSRWSSSAASSSRCTA